MKILKILAIIMAMLTVFTACAGTETEIVPEYDPEFDTESPDLRI